MPKFKCINPGYFIVDILRIYEKIYNQFFDQTTEVYQLLLLQHFTWNTSLL